MIGKLFRYLFPVLLLPLLSNLTSALNTRVAAMLGVSVVAACSVVNAVSSLFNTFMYILTLVGLVCAAMMAEKGNVRGAKGLLRVFRMLFLGVTAAMSMLFIMAPGAVLAIYSYAPEVLGYGSVMLKGFGVMVLVTAAVCTLLMLALRRYSMTVTLIGSIVLLVVSSVVMPVLVLQGNMAANGIGYGLGLQYAAVRVLPFLLIPVDAFCRDFEPKVGVEF